MENANASMKNKIIFLDVDGELTYSNYQNINTANIDIEKVKLLREICDRTGAKVVISSSWRGTEHRTPRIYYILMDILESEGIDVVGNTPYIDLEFDRSTDTSKPVGLEEIKYTRIKHGTGRAAEVQKYVEDNKVDAFVILDDEDYDWKDYGYSDNWIQPTWYDDGGLQREHVEKAVKILNNQG